MKITKKALDYFNCNHKKGMDYEPAFNECYNKAKGMPSRAEWAFMKNVQWEKFGMCRERITMKMIKEYQE